MKVIVLAAIAASLGCSASHAVRIGDAAPDFRVKVSGEQRYERLSDSKGKVVLLSIISTDCGPCKEQLSNLQRLRDSLPATSRLLIIAEDSGAASSMTEAFGSTVTLLHDPSRAVERDYRIEGFPELFVIDRDGVLRNRWRGTNDMSNQALLTAVRALSKAD